MPYTYPVTIHHLYISPGHNYFGHRAGMAGTQPTYDVAAVAVKAGAGLVGDRFFGRGVAFDGHVTFLAWEVVQLLTTAYALPIATPADFRRNVVIAGVPLNGLIGQTFAIDGVQFQGNKHCAPCRWMESAVATGALQALKGTRRLAGPSPQRWLVAQRCSYVDHHAGTRPHHHHCTAGAPQVALS